MNQEAPGYGASVKNFLSSQYTKVFGDPKLEAEIAAYGDQISKFDQSTVLVFEFGDNDYVKINPSYILEKYIVDEGNPLYAHTSYLHQTIAENLELFRGDSSKQNITETWMRDLKNQNQKGVDIYGSEYLTPEWMATRSKRYRFAKVTPRREQRKILNNYIIDPTPNEINKLLRLLLTKDEYDDVYVDKISNQEKNIISR